MHLPGQTTTKRVGCATGERALGHHRFNRRRPLYGPGLRLATCLCIVGTLCAHTLVRAERSTAGTVAQDPVTFYSSSGERREAGRVRRPFSWLDVSALAEAEWQQRRSHTFDRQASTRDEGPDAVLQLEWEARLTPWAKIELGHEYDTAQGRHTLEEFVLVVDRRDVELTLGRQYLPFGQYFSHFVSGPVLEFAETQADGALLSVGLSENLEWSWFAFDGQVQDQGSRRQFDWGMAIDWQGEYLSYGVGYLSDLAESDAALLKDQGSRYRRRVDALAAHFRVFVGAIEASAEGVGALAGIDALDNDRDRPSAWNLELAHQFRPNWQWALRYEGSRELEDEPERRWGAALSWQAAESLVITVEYLRGRYRRGLAEDPDGGELRRDHLVGLRLGWLL